MSIKRILAVALSATALSTVAWASDTYQCGESRCYDDQADETRRLNLMQLEDARAVNDAAPGYDNADGSYDDPDNAPYDGGDDDSDMNGQGGPYDPYDPSDDEGYGPPPPDAGPPSGAYDPDAAAPPYGPPPDTGAYPDDDSESGYPNDDDDAPYPDDDE